MSLLTTEKALQLLIEDERNNPEAVYANFFENFEFDDAMRQLREARNSVLKDKFGLEGYSIEKNNVQFFFEKLEKVMEAAWMMK